MRVTESIGPQRVSVPNVVGETEREASVTIRRLSLDLGTVAYVPAPGPSGMVLAQTPTPAAAGVDGPRISLLVSEPLPVFRVRQMTSGSSGDSDTPDSAATDATPAATPEMNGAGTDPGSAAAAAGIPATTTADQPDAYVMPNLLGLPLPVATARLGTMGLKVTSVETAAGSVRSVAPIASPGSPGSSTPGGIRPVAPPAAITAPNTVVSQSPGIGRRVTKTDTIHLVVSR
jgi:beta-lactam-binding protein with PASTA domain